MSENIKHEKFLSQYLQEKGFSPVWFFFKIFKGLDKTLFFNSRSRLGKIEIFDQGLSRFNLDKPWSSRQVQGQLFQGQGLYFKGEYSIFIQGFFKGNPWNSSKFKATSRETFSRILQPLICNIIFFLFLQWSLMQHSNLQWWKAFLSHMKVVHMYRMKWISALVF